MKLSNYEERLFELLPQLYHVYDNKGDGSLKAFLKAVGATLDDMERNIAELYGDSFIESCHEWVVPYIGQLIGAKLIETDGNRNRQEVMKTIRWRKRKGTLKALEDMASQITGWGVRAAEFFEQLGWSQNLNHIKLGHLQSPDLTDHKALFYLGSANNRLLHTVDIREPVGRQGWFQIKNIGFFLSTVALSHYQKVPMQEVVTQPNTYTLASEGFPVDLFDGSSRFPLSKTVALKERFDRFGSGQTVDIFSQGILVATPEMPKWKGSPAVAPPHESLLNLKDENGLLPISWNIADGRPLQYTITPMVLFESANKATLKALGNLDLSVSPLKYIRDFDGSSEEDGRLVIRVTPQSGYNKSFPGMVLILQSHHQHYEVSEGEGDRQKGVYKDRMYCYLPTFCPVPGESKDFVIDRYGSAYHYYHNDTQKQPEDEVLFDFIKLVRATEGFIYPSRKLTASTRVLPPLYSLAQENALQVVDRGQFQSSLAPAEGWTIKAWNRDNQIGGGILRLLASLKITSLADKVVHAGFKNHSIEYPGHLIISLYRDSPGWVPEFELIVTDERGKSILVYLPQMDDLDSAGKFFYVADDGATYKVNGKPIPNGIVVERGPVAGPDGAFNRENLGHYSAGQVLPIGGKTPIQQRVAIRCNLSRKVQVQPGFVAIDPVIGRVAFAENEKPEMPISANYYHGFSACLGAGPYFYHWNSTEENRIFRVSKRTAPADNHGHFYRHLRPPKLPDEEKAAISKIRVFHTIQEAIDHVISRGSSVNNLPWIIRIEDSEVYDEIVTVSQPIPCGLIIRAAEFQRPVWRGRIIWNAPDNVMTPLLVFQGLTITHSMRISTGGFKEIQFKDCTLLRKLFIFKGVKGEEDRYLQLVIDNCILRDRMRVNNYCEIRITNSALDAGEKQALVAERSTVRLERCTIMRMIAVKRLYASESIFMGTIQVFDSQKGCVRYCRIAESGNTLPYTYKPTTAPVTFCSDLPWNSRYLKLKRICHEPVTRWAENGGEIGVYHQANYTLKQKNLMLKFEEYLPVGLTPVLIDL